MNLNPTQCKSCQRPVIWIRTIHGHRAPVDAVPVPAGKFVLRESEGADNVPRAYYASPEDPRYVGEDRYDSHFATCPDANDWRKGSRK